MKDTIAPILFLAVDSDLRVFTCSSPFTVATKKFLYAELTSKKVGHQSVVRLFEEVSENTFSVVPENMTYQLEAPQVMKIGSDLFFCGRRVIMDIGRRANYYYDMYKGDAERIVYYTATPDRVEANLCMLADSRIGVFVAGADSAGFFSVDNVVHLTADAYKTAVPIDKAAFLGMKGTVYQSWLLKSGQIGCVAQHYSEVGSSDDKRSSSIISFVLDPASMAVTDTKVILDSTCLACDDKERSPVLFVRPSGLFFEDEKCFLYCSAHFEDDDVQIVKVNVADPFGGDGKIVVPLEF